MKKFLTIYLLLILVFILSVNLILAEEKSTSASKGTVEGTVSNSSDTDGIKLKYPWSDATDFKGLVSRFYNIALGLVGVAALGAIIYGGILWTVSKTPSGSQEAKDWITGAIWGLLLLLGAYLLFNTIGIIENGKLVEPGITGITEKETAATTPTTPSEIAKTLSDQQAKSQLNTAKVSYKSNVSFNGIRQATIDEAKALSFDLQKKGIGIISEQITSGTEGTHAEGTYSHANGYKIDLRMNDNLTKFIENNYTRIQDRTEKDGTKIPQYQNSRGAVYAKEGDHWDVLVK